VIDEIARRLLRVFISGEWKTPSKPAYEQTEHRA
jgi:hypothetical protein